MPDSESLNPDNFSKYIFFYLQKKQWISKKQYMVILLSKEMEYMTLTEASKKVIYLKNFMKKFKCFKFGLFFFH